MSQRRRRKNQRHAKWGQKKKRCFATRLHRGFFSLFRKKVLRISIFNSTVVFIHTVILLVLFYFKCSRCVVMSSLECICREHKYSVRSQIYMNVCYICLCCFLFVSSFSHSFPFFLHIHSPFSYRFGVDLSHTQLLLFRYTL